MFSHFCLQYHLFSWQSFTCIHACLSIHFLTITLLCVFAPLFSGFLKHWALANHWIVSRLWGTYLLYDDIKYLFNLNNMEPFSDQSKLFKMRLFHKLLLSVTSPSAIYQTERMESLDKWLVKIMTVFIDMTITLHLCIFNDFTRNINVTISSRRCHMSLHIQDWAMISKYFSLSNIRLWLEVECNGISFTTSQKKKITNPLNVITYFKSPVCI